LVLDFVLRFVASISFSWVQKHLFLLFHESIMFNVLHFNLINLFF
jgi:hypothetical protein